MICIRMVHLSLCPGRPQRITTPDLRLPRLSWYGMQHATKIYDVTKPIKVASKP